MMLKRSLKLFLLIIIVCFGITTVTHISANSVKNKTNTPTAGNELKNSPSNNISVSALTPNMHTSKTPVTTKVPTATPVSTEPPVTPSPTPVPTKQPIPDPTLVSPVPVGENIDPSKPMVAFTFDDGPSSKITDRILNVLENNKLKATFFIVGDRLKSSSARETLLRAYNLGAEIGNHTYAHPRLTKLTAEQIVWQIEETNSLVESITSVKPKLVRPPYGAYNDLVFANVGYPLMLWSMDTRDWESRNAKVISDYIMKNIKDGDIILMHDLKDFSAEAFEIVVPQLLKQGYQFVTVSELFAYRNKDLHTRVAYGKRVQ